MGAKSTVTTDVEIFGSVYHVRGEKEPENLRELASEVDTKMRTIAEQVNTLDTAKIAILAALNLADELARYRTKHEGERAEIQEKVTELAGELERTLKTK